MRRLTIIFFLIFAQWAHGEDVVPEVPPPIPLARTTAPIVVDGDLNDEGWRGAAVIDTFFETVYGDNRSPLVGTVARVIYDDRYLYVALDCQDPEPGKIRAPFADRDDVIGTDDNVAIFLDTRNDRRSAVEFRVNPRGIQGDAVFYDANGNEDFAPDFFYDTAARITETGWQAELRIPLTSLRYARTDPQNWGIIVWRNYPRDRRYAIYSSPQPRGANCLICRSRELTGLTGLPHSNHLVVAPYAAVQDAATAPEPGAPLGESDREGRVGLDVKWNPTAGTALDATINPDYSQIEADIAQIAVNNRFALFYPEKRPFFLEGVDLLDTPIQSVYTRTITSPRFGGRATGKLGANSYTVLMGQDRGGGSVIIPGPYASDFAPQDFRSLFSIARIRRDFGQSYLGVLYTDREIEDGGFNRVIGPDFQWRPNQREIVTAQFLYADTETPRRPELWLEWDGRKIKGHALSVQWRHNTQTWIWNLQYHDVGDGFRADLGFVPQVGIRLGRGQIAYQLFPSGFFNQAQPYVVADRVEDRHGSLVEQRIGPGFFVLGRKNLMGQADLTFERVRAGSVVLPRNRLAIGLQVDPGRQLPRVRLEGVLGEDIDFVNQRTGNGAEITAAATVRPTSHVTLDASSAYSWLDVDDDRGPTGRLFSAQVQRLRAQYTFSARAYLRLIAQWIEVKRDPELYGVPVPDRSGDFSGSFLFSYKLNWQTALFVGYGDDRALDDRKDLARTGRQFFLKLSYAFQR